MILSSSSAPLVHRQYVSGGSRWGWCRTWRWDSSGGETGAAIPSVQGCTEVWDGLTAERDTCYPPPGTNPPPTAGTSWTDCWAETRCTPLHNPLWHQRKQPWGSRLCSERRRHCSRRYLRGKNRKQTNYMRPFWSCCQSRHTLMTSFSQDSCGRKTSGCYWKNYRRSGAPKSSGSPCGSLWELNELHVCWWTVYTSKGRYGPKRSAPEGNTGIITSSWGPELKDF